MILTCPDCATSYFVDDDRVPPQGRTVKCTSCGNRWHATPDGASEPAIVPPPRSTPTENSNAPIVRATPIVDDLEVIAPAAEAGSKHTTSAPKSKAPRTGLIVGVIAAVGLAAAIGASVLFRQLIVDAAPASASAFRALGLEVDTLGLVIENVTSKAVLQAGRPTLAITGVIHNKNHTATEAPPIRISLLDEAGEPLAGVLAQPLNARVPPGARRYFSVSMPDPPAGARELEVAFDLTEKTPASHAPASGHAPDVAEAKPLPANSPDAIAPHEPH